MIFNFKRLPLVMLLAVLALVFPRGARADEGDPPEVEAQRLTHILGYTAADYGGAVANGAIVSQTEYEEQLALLTDAAKIAAHLRAPAPPDLAAQVARVRALVDRKAPEAEVGAAVAEVRASVTAAFQLAEAPATAPDPVRGRS